MSEYKRVFDNGAWVKGENVNSQSFAHGLVCDFDPEDGQHLVLEVFGPDTNESMWHREWCDTKSLEAAEAPEWFAGGTPGHAFVCDWMDDSVANVALFARPEDALGFITDMAIRAEEDGGPATPGTNLQLKLMECVADPGERVELPGGVGVRFLVVNG